MRRRYLLGLVITSIPVSLVGTVAWLGVFTFVNGYIVKELGYSNREWTSSTLWFLGGVIVWQLMCTEISSKIGRRTTMSVSMAVVSLAYVGMALSHNLLLIRLFLGLMGFFIASSNAAWIPMIVSSSGSEPGRALAAYQLVAIVASQVAIIGGGYLIGGVSYQTAFVIFGVVAIASAICFHLTSRSFAVSGGSKIVSLRSVSRRDLMGLVRGPFIVLLVIGFCMEPFNFHTVNQLFPNLARDVHHFSEEKISLTVALGRTPAMLSIFVLAGLIDRIRSLRCYSLGFLAAGLLVMAQGYASGTLWFVAAYVSYFLVWGIVMASNCVTVASTVEPRLVDSAFAIIGVASLASTFLVGIAHNRLVGADLPLSQVFILCGLMAAAAGLSLLIYSLTRHSMKRPPDGSSE